MGFEVIVVGAGPTGLMLAAELALADVRTRVVERRTEATRNSRALTLHPRSVELMDLRGIARRFLSEGPTAPGWHFANLPTPLDFSRLDSRRGYTLVLPQARTEAILETRARELGVRIDRGQQVVGLEQDAAGVSVEVRDVAGGVTEDRYWSESWTNTERVLTAVTDWLRKSRAVRVIEIDEGWAHDRDVSVLVGRWAWLDIRALVEEHSAGRALLRVNMFLRPTSVGVLSAIAIATGLVISVSAGFALRWPLAGIVVSVLAG